jgi:hypothetical protein
MPNLPSIINDDETLTAPLGNIFSESLAQKRMVNFLAD